MQTASDLVGQAALENRQYEDFLDSIAYFDGAEDLQKHLAIISDVDKVGVRWHYLKNNPTTETALALAVRLNNTTAVKALLARGANPLASTTLSGTTIIGEAVTQGAYEIVDAILNKFPKLVETRLTDAQGQLHHFNLLHSLILQLGSYSLIQHGIPPAPAAGERDGGCFGRLLTRCAAPRTHACATIHSREFKCNE